MFYLLYNFSISLGSFTVTFTVSNPCTATLFSSSTIDSISVKIKFCILSYVGIDSPIFQVFVHETIQQFQKLVAFRSHLLQLRNRLILSCFSAKSLHTITLCMSLSKICLPSISWTFPEVKKFCSSERHTPMLLHNEKDSHLMEQFRQMVKVYQNLSDFPLLHHRI